jgi:hypothetical protein
MKVPSFVLVFLAAFICLSLGQDVIEKTEVGDRAVFLFSHTLDCPSYTCVIVVR